MDGPTPPGFGVPETMIALFKAELEPGERLLWAGSPGRYVTHRAGRLSSSLIWFLGFLGVTLACGKLALRDRGPAALGTTAAVLSLVSAVAAFFTLTSILARLDPRRVGPKGTTYALTDRRLIVRRRLARSAVEVASIWRGQVGRLHRVEAADGSGDVVLHPAGTQAGLTPAVLEGVPDVRRVEDIARRVLLASTTEPA